MLDRQSKKFMPELNWKMGFEIEMMAPRGLSREDLAESIAQANNGLVQRIFYPQSELSKVPGTPLFHNLTLGFEIRDRRGNLIAQCVDDLTLQDDLDKNIPAKAGWYRIVSDDSRFLQLVECQANPADSATEVLAPIARLFMTDLVQGEGEMRRVADRTGNPIAIALPLPGERERPCELITPPIKIEHRQRLDLLLEKARSLGFTAPVEGATHIHFDGLPLCDAAVFANLVNLLWTHGENLRQLVGTNPRCRRLGRWDEALLASIDLPHFSTLTWAEAQELLRPLNLTKYCDFNLKNLIHSTPNKLTFEARIFPTWMDSPPIIAAAALIEAILRQAISTPIAPAAPLDWELASVGEFLQSLPMSEDFRKIWLERAAIISN
jgi:hypothetical protein